jgi:hypothetical protein
MKKDDDEDAPAYVMEETNQALTKEEYDDFVSGKDPKEMEDPKEDTAETGSKPQDKIAQVGSNARKRKAAKIISDDSQQSKEDDEKDVKKSEAKVVKKLKKKTKAVKLTFGDEDEV